MGAMSRTWLVLSMVFVLVGLSACAAVFASDAVGAAKAEDTITLELKDVDVRSAIEAVFRNTGKNLWIGPDVHGTIPVLSFKDVSFKTALKNLTRSAGLVCREDGGVYMISKKPEVNNPIIRDLPKIEPYVEEPTTSEIRVEKIPLNYSSASEILAVMSGAGREYGGAYGTTGNSGYGGYPGYGGYSNRGGYGSGYPGYGDYSNRGGYGSGYPGYGGYGNRSGYGNSGYGGYPGSGGYPGYGNYGGYGSRGW